MKKTYKISARETDENIRSLFTRQFFIPLLEMNLVDGILLPRKSSAGGIVASLLKNPDFAEVYFTSPVQLVNAAQLVSDLTFKEPGDKVAALLRPCEVRALVELEKLQQVDLEHLLIIGVDCLGTCEPEEFKRLKEERGDELIAERSEALRAGQVGDFPRREACQFCQHPEVPLADINLALIGSEEEEVLLEARSEEGEEFLAKLNIEEAEPSETRQELLEALIKENKAAWEQELESFAARIGDISGLIEVLDLCRTCFNCRTACPICYCRECVFTTLTFEHEGRKYIKWAERKGSIKMPSDTLLFHLTRLNHMGLSCIACGQCESACPSDIPLLKIFKLIGERAQDHFSYLPGDNLEETLPLTTYEEDEFEPK